MSGFDDDPDPADDTRTDDPAPIEEGNGTPTLACSRCNREWDLVYELDHLTVGNRAVERFALDHRRHTGHFPDGVTPWLVDCTRCPDEETFLSERPARRFAETHARHTNHSVVIESPAGAETQRLGPDDVPPADGSETD